jgi:TPR repeat protein
LSTCLAARPAELRLSQDEIGKLFKRGEEYMGQGRISAARPLFQRAAEACDMRAAYALGATYDPIMLRKLGATLLDPDVAVARAWYEQARGLGLSEASRQLKLLSGLSR